MTPMASRDLDDLVHNVRLAALEVIHICKKQDVNILIYCTFRSVEEQSKLYRNGRPIQAIQRKADELSDVYNRPDLSDILMEVGPQYGDTIVTYAGPGQSMHNYGLAFDSVPIIHGKAMWSTSAPEWFIYGEACAAAGLEWAGTWSLRRREYPHAQDLGMSWRDLIAEYDYELPYRET